MLSMGESGFRPQCTHAHKDGLARLTWKDTQIRGWLYFVKLDTMLENDNLNSHPFSKRRELAMLA